MALDTYAALQDAINDWRGDTLFSARAPDFITLVEATLNRTLRTRFQETVAVVVTSSGSVALPTDYLGWRTLRYIATPSHALEYVTPEYLRNAFPDPASGAPPRVFTIEAGFIKVRPYDDTTLHFYYYAKIPALSVTNTSNWLLASYPDIYLYGALAESENFGQNDERMPMWKAKRDEAIEQLQRLSNKSAGVGGMHVLGPTP